MKRWVIGLSVLPILGACSQASPTDNRPLAPRDAGASATEPTPDAAAPEPPVPVAESCDPYEPRAKPVELLIGPTGLEGKLTSLVDGAEKSLDILMYELYVPGLVEALVRAHERGVRVRIVLDGKQTENRSSRAKLEGAGIEVHSALDSYPHFHSKVAIVDGARALVMSANMNGFSMSSERNYGVIVEDADDVGDLAAIFENDFAGGAAQLPLECTRLVVSPINARPRLLELMQSAQSRLDFAVMYISDREVLSAIEAQKRAGTKVRVLLAAPEWMAANRDTGTRLAKAGIEVRYFRKYELHAKLVVTDRAAFIGSENFSFGSLDSNREVGVFLTNAEPLDRVRSQFDADWAAGETQ